MSLVTSAITDLTSVVKITKILKLLLQYTGNTTDSIQYPIKCGRPMCNQDNILESADFSNIFIYIYSHRLQYSTEHKNLLKMVLFSMSSLIESHFHAFCFITKKCRQKVNKRFIIQCRV